MWETFKTCILVVNRSFQQHLLKRKIGMCQRILFLISGLLTHSSKKKAGCFVHMLQQEFMIPPLYRCWESWLITPTDAFVPTSPPSATLLSLGMA